MNKKTSQRDDSVFIKGMSSLMVQNESLMRTPERSEKFHSSPIKKQKKAEEILNKKDKIRAELFNKLYLYYKSKNMRLSSNKIWEISEYARKESEKVTNKGKTLQESFNDYIKENGKE